MYAEVPEDYQANYGIAKVREDITQDFITIQAQKKIGEQPNVTTFSRLKNNFELVFPRLPQKNNYKITFEQCELITAKLSTSYSTRDFDTFIDQCQGPLNTIMKDINNNYSVKANIKANPNSGSAPLTVTFDGRSSTDPSKDTIPSSNFFRYYKNGEGEDILIGKGTVVKHTFEEEGNYLVHLTARSANNISEGILDGDTNISVNVSPETANLIVYANGKKLQSKTYTKIGTFEAQKGILLDATPSQPKGGREIIQHRREVSGSNGFTFQSEDFPTKPSSITVKIPNNGAYTVTITTTDNENNISTKKYLLAVSDPIAIIKQTPEKASTSNIVRFDGNASYAIQSRIKQYNWELFDEQGEKLFVSQTKDFSKQFTQPGTYTVKLRISDELGQSNEESKIVFVESSDPQAQFSITPRLDRENPSQFVLDAGSSNDKDVTAGYDNLSYDRSFSNSSQVTIEQKYDNNKSIVVSFADPGKYKIKLIVSDSYGKVNTLEKEIEVKSSLRPIVYASPRASIWGQPIIFIVKSNSTIINYERDFGDGTKSSIQNSNTKKAFNKVGTYNVKLTVTDKKGQKNTVTTQVFIGEKDYPVGAYTITNMSQNIIKPNEKCNTEDAFPIERLEKFNVDITESVNGRGEKQNLNFFFQPLDDEIYKTNRFQYQFKKVGCLYIDTIIEDTTTSKQDKKRIWFKVSNSLPTLNSLNLSFPQFGNEIGVGLGQGTKEKAFDPTTVSPLIVKVNAIQTKDNDGFISQYLRYYYKKDDPGRKLDLKVTPSNAPNVFFSIFSEPGEIVFGVKMIDNDGGEQTSEQIIGQGPTIFIPPQGDNNMDIPIVTLSVDKVNINVGEEITFTTKAKILSQRPDFNAKKTIQYDFDGDGQRDKTTKDDVVKYTYTKAYPDGVRPRVQVSYRGFPVTSDGDIINVKDGLKAILEYAIYDKTIIVRDYSYGKVAKKELCFDGRISCKQKTTYSGDFSAYNYPEYGTYMTLLTISDLYGNNAIHRQKIEIVEPKEKEDPFLLTIPQAKKENGKFVISVGEQSKNSILFHVITTIKGLCYIDKDATYDTNNDKNPANDKDILCNDSKLISYKALSNNLLAKLIYEKEINGIKKLVSNDIVIEFIDQQVNLSPSQEKLYKTITSLSESLSDNKQIEKDLKVLLNQLAESIFIGTESTDLILQIKDFSQKNTIGLSSSQEEILNTIIEELSDGNAIAAMGGSLYDQSKANLIQFAPESIKSEIKNIFNQIELLGEPAAEGEKVKEYLVQLLSIFASNAVEDSDLGTIGNENKIAKSDIEIVIMPEVCNILGFYEIASEQCRPIEEGGGGTLGEEESATSSGNSTLTNILKKAGIVVGILFLLFIIIVGFFAIKAKLQQENDDEEQT